MPTHPTDYSRRRPWRTTCLILGLLLVCYCSGIWALIPPLRHAAINHLTWTQGQAELIVGAHKTPKGASLSPDGRWMVFRQQADGPSGTILWDLTTDQYRHLAMPITHVRWLNPTQFVVTASAGPTGYFLFDIPQDAWQSLPRYPDEAYTQPGWQTSILNRWWAADQVYVLHTFSAAGYTIITKEQDGYHLYHGMAYDTEVEQQLLAKVDHILVLEYARPAPRGTGQRINSPDGRWYVTIERGPYVNVAAVYTQGGQLVARAYKMGWHARVLGWAHDGSGVYVQFAVDGSAAMVRQPTMPVYKLSPFTPVEAAWHVAHQVLFGLIIVLGGIDLGVQARRQREAGD